MKRLFNTASTLLIALLISAFGMVNYASAMPIAEQGHAQHASASPSNCTSICIGVPADKKQKRLVLSEDDDKPQPPYYFQFESAQTSWFAEKRLVARSIEQPSKIPKYQLCCTIRR